MNTNKILMGGIAGAVAFFLLGWLVYGMLLMDFMTANTNQCAMKPMADMTWWAIILSNLISALLLAMIFSWSNISGMAAGAKTAAIIGLMMSLSHAFSSYAMSTMYNDMTTMLVLAVAHTVIYTIAGAVIAWVMGMSKAKAA